MSSGEVAGIAALAVSCGLTTGVVLAVLISTRQSQRARRYTRRADAYTAWLGAHLTASRASLSFVAAFRALAAERSDSVYFELRITEAQRARAYWCYAMQRLDVAEAVLIALEATNPRDNLRAWFFRIRPDALRYAINGPESKVEELAKRLHTADRAAIDFMRNALANGKVKVNGRGIVDKLVRTVRRLEAIVDRWGDLQ